MKTLFTGWYCPKDCDREPIEPDKTSDKPRCEECGSDDLYPYMFGYSACKPCGAVQRFSATVSRCAPFGGTYLIYPFLSHTEVASKYRT